MTRGHVAFVDDEAELCAAVADWLETSGFTVETWTDPLRALEEIDLARTDAVITDLRMPGLTGDALMAAFRAREPDLPVVLMSAHADIPVAVAAMRDGAHDFIEKPCAAEYLAAVTQRAVEWRLLRRELVQLRAPQSQRRVVEQRLIGRSPQVAHLRDMALRLADVPVDMLLKGEPGTGREDFARLVHDLSARARRPFVALDCAAIPEAALEAELFGQERGGNPPTARQGRFEFANGGTIFLSEVEALSPALQARLARFLQDRTFTRVGDNVSRPVDVRLVAATSADLSVLLEQGRFRRDLYFRLTTAEVLLPSLSERPEDIPLLYAHYLMEAARRFRRPEPTPGAADLEMLTVRRWPGNLTQLQTAAERQVLGFRAGNAAGPERDIEAGLPLAQKVAEFEASLIMEALAQSGGSSAGAAERLGLPRRTLNEKIARYGLRER